MQRSWRRQALAAALITTLAASCGAATARTTHGLTNVTVSAVANEGVAGLYIAQGKGYFRTHGLHVTIQTVTSSAGALPDLLHGRVNVIVGQYSTVIQAEAKGLGPFRVLGPGWNLGSHVEGIVVPKSAPVPTVPDLVGKKIAVNAIGGIDQLLTDNLLSLYHIKPSQVTYVPVPFQAMGVALAAHRVDAADLTEPYLTEAKLRYGVSRVADLDSGPADNLPVSGYTTTQAWLSQNRRTAMAFAAAVAEGNAQVTLHLNVFQQAMEHLLQLSPLVAAVMATGTFPIGLTVAQLQAVADILYRYGGLKQPFSVAGMLL